MISTTEATRGGICGHLLCCLIQIYLSGSCNNATSHENIMNKCTQVALIARRLGITDLADWYGVSSLQLSRAGGSKLVSRQRSLAQVLLEAYPAHNWEIWKFRRVPSQFWLNMENQRRFFDALSSKLNPSGSIPVNLERWYNVDSSFVEQFGGRTLLWCAYDGSLLKALEAVYPQHEWLGWKFKHVPRGFWQNMVNRVRYFDWVSSQFGFRSLDDWYSVSFGEVLDRGGNGFIKRYYNGCVATALIHAYPNHSWHPWRWEQVPKHFWDSVPNQKDYMDWLTSERGMKLEDWYTVTRAQYGDMHGLWSLLASKYSGSLQAALSAIYPDHKWQSNLFCRSLLGK